jgi:hypothetical protein
MDPLVTPPMSARKPGEEIKTKYKEAVSITVAMALRTGHVTRHGTVLSGGYARLISVGSTPFTLPHAFLRFDHTCVYS